MIYLLDNIINKLKKIKNKLNLQLFKVYIYVNL